MFGVGTDAGVVGAAGPAEPPPRDVTIATQPKPPSDKSNKMTPQMMNLNILPLSESSKRENENSFGILKVSLIFSGKSDHIIYHNYIIFLSGRIARPTFL